MPAGESQVIAGGRVVAINLARQLRTGTMIERDGKQFIVTGGGLTAVLRSIAVSPSQRARVVGINPQGVSPWVAVMIFASLAFMLWRGSYRG